MPSLFLIGHRKKIYVTNLQLDIVVVIVPR